MNKKDDNSSAEELVQKFLKKNKNFFIKHPELLKELQFPLKDEGSEKVIDLQVYRNKKINQVFRKIVASPCKNFTSIIFQGYRSARPFVQKAIKFFHI